MTDTPTPIAPETDELDGVVYPILAMLEQFEGEPEDRHAVKQSVDTICDALIRLRAEVATLRASEARMREALRPFSIMAGEMFARNWNKDGVAISFVGKDGPIRLTFEHFMAARMAVTAEKGADNELA